MANALLWVSNQTLTTTITFDSNVGSSVDPITGYPGDPTTTPDDPTRNGYTFAGWTPAIPATFPASDLTVTATWNLNDYSVWFYSEGSVFWTYSPLHVGDPVPLPPTNPVRSGYTFTGWSPAVPATYNTGFNTTYAQWEATAIPTISVTGSISAFTSCSGSVSTAQSFTASGTDLTDDIIITAPVGFEVSTDIDSGYSGSISLPQSGGNVSSTTVYVRLTNTAAGTPSGNVSLTSPDAGTQNIPVSGTVNPLPAAAGSITGTTVVCQGDLSAFGYSVDSIQDADTYVWTLPSGATGSSTTNYILVTYGATAVSGDIVVKGHNSCGDGTESTLGITVNTKPVFTLSPTDQSVNTDPGVCTANVSYTETLSGSPVPTLTYSFSGATTASGSGDGSGSTFNKGITNVTITATNICGTKSCNFAITVNDNVAPVFTCRSDTMVYTTPPFCWYQVPALPQANFFTPIGMGDNCSIYTWSNNSNGLTNIAGTVFNVGNNTVTWTITDGSGNTATCAQTVTVKENVPPVITCPLSQTQTTDPGVCGANITIPQFNGGCDIQHGFTGHYQPSLWTVVHINGDAGSVNTGGAPGSITIQGSNNLSSNPSEIRYQNLIPCDGTLSFDWSYSTTDVNTLWDPMGYYLNGTYHQLTINGGPLSQSGSVSIPVSNGDVFSFSINTLDNYGGASTTINSNFSAPVPGGTAGDNCGIASIINNFNNTNDASGIYPVGTTPVEWTVTDLSGNTASCTQTITVTDNEPPTITCPANINAPTVFGDASCETHVTITDATAADNCSAVSVSGVRSDLLAFTDPYPVGTTTITWTATDGANNTATCTQSVNIVDGTLPIIDCPNDITKNNDPGVCGAVVNYTVNYSDNCPGAVLEMVSGISSGSVFPVGTTMNIYKVTDASGNTATCTQTITVTDNENPTISCATPLASYSTDGGSCYYTVPDNSLDPTATHDNCSVASVINDFNNLSSLNGATFPKGTTTVTWTVTDGSSNTATCTQTIIVKDNENPIITCPVDITASTDPGLCTASGVDLGTPVTTDNCSVANVTNDAVEPYHIGVNYVVWTVTDSAGNSANCTQTITVSDNEKPIITCPGDITVIADPGVCSTMVTFSDATATDNCTSSLSGNQTFNFTGSIENYTVPAGVTSLTIEAKGAHGGGAPYWGTLGGLGAIMSGVFTVIPGHVLNIMVGQQAAAGEYGAGGGGGSFVWDVTAGNTLLIAAGGGGGSSSTNGANAVTSINGTSGPANYGGGGVNGNGATGSFNKRICRWRCWMAV